MEEENPRTITGTPEKLKYEIPRLFHNAFQWMAVDPGSTAMKWRMVEKGREY